MIYVLARMSNRSDTKTQPEYFPLAFCEAIFVIHVGHPTPRLRPIATPRHQDGALSGIVGWAQHSPIVLSGYDPALPPAGFVTR